MEKIFERFLPVALITNDGGGFQPEQFAFFVIIGAALPTPPAASAKSSPKRAGNSCCGIHKGAPGAAWLSGTKGCGVAREHLMIVVDGPHAAAGGEQVAEIRSVPLVDPKQIGF